MRATKSTVRTTKFRILVVLRLPTFESNFATLLRLLMEMEATIIAIDGLGGGGGGGRGHTYPIFFAKFTFVILEIYGACPNPSHLSFYVNFWIYSFSLRLSGFTFKAILSCFLFRSFLSKNRDISPLAGTPGTGSKNRDCPGKIETLGRPAMNLYVMKWEGTCYGEAISRTWMVWAP